MTERKENISNLPVPKVGELIYIPSAIFLGHGRDDRVGGRDYVSGVKLGISAGAPAYFVETRSFPGLWHNWEFLSQKQKSLKDRFGQDFAYPDPDLRPEFNDW